MLNELSTGEVIVFNDVTGFGNDPNEKCKVIISRKGREYDYIALGDNKCPIAWSKENSFEEVRKIYDDLLNKGYTPIHKKAIEPVNKEQVKECLSSFQQDLKLFNRRIENLIQAEVGKMLEEYTLKRNMNPVDFYYMFYNNFRYNKTGKDILDPLIPLIQTMGGQ